MSDPVEFVTRGALVPQKKLLVAQLYQKYSSTESQI